MGRRISSWDKPAGSNWVRGKALQDLGYDCFAVYCSVLVYEQTPGQGDWFVVLERAGFQPQSHKASSRFYGMMLAEHLIAEQWSDWGIARHIAANREAYKGSETPGSIPVTDCKKFPFWKAKPTIGPKEEPAYMRLLTPEILEIAKAPPAWPVIRDVLEHVGLEPFLEIEARREAEDGDP